MKIRSTHRALAGAVLAAIGLGLAAAPANAATTGTIRPASSPLKKVIGQGLNSALGAASNASSAKTTWTIFASSKFPDTFFIRQKDSLSGKTLYMDISGGSSTSAGMPIVTSKFDGSSSQRWRLVEVSDGRYTVQNNHSKKFLNFRANGGSAPLTQQINGAFGEQRFDLSGNP